MKPQVVKSVELTREQIKKLRKEFSNSHELTEVVFEMLVKAALKIAEDKAAYWDEIARLLGYEDKIDAHEKGVEVRVSWLRGVAEAIANKEEQL